MARMRSKWYQPYTLTPNRTGTAVTVKIRRRHPALLWLAMRLVQPRELWRPIVWLAIVRAYWRLGQ